MTAVRGSIDCADMGDERGDDGLERHTRADVYSSARIGARDRARRDPASRRRPGPPVGAHVGSLGAMSMGVANDATERSKAPGWRPGPSVSWWRSTQRGLPISPAALGDPVPERRLADLAAGDAPDNVIGLIRIAGCGDPRSAIALNELDRG